MLPTVVTPELWYAQYCVMKPGGVTPVGNTTTYCVDAFDADVVLPKCFAARTADARIDNSAGCATAL